MHLIDSLPKPIIFGHRGASRYAPENTIAAFDLAIEQGARAFELDTMLTADGVPVVIHDHTLERTTNGQGEVNQQSADEILSLDAGSLFSPVYEGEKVPLLKDVLDRYNKDILINIELKNYHSPSDDLVSIVFDLVKESGMLEHVIFSSFLPKNLRILRSLNPKVKVALLTLAGLPGFLFRSELYRGVSPEFIHPCFENVSRGYVEREHQKNRKVNVWTVKIPASAKKLIEWGVDGLITDAPQLMLELL